MQKLFCVSLNGYLYSPSERCAVLHCPAPLPHPETGTFRRRPCILVLRKQILAGESSTFPYSVFASTSLCTSSLFFCPGSPHLCPPIPPLENLMVTTTSLNSHPPIPSCPFPSEYKGGKPNVAQKANVTHSWNYKPFIV